MAIPPIIANSPIFKLFKSEQTNISAETPQQAPPTSTEDVVEISEAAQQRLQGVQQLNAEQAPQIAEETGDVLRENENVTLGLDSDFAE